MYAQAIKQLQLTRSCNLRGAIVVVVCAKTGVVSVTKTNNRSMWVTLTPDVSFLCTVYAIYWTSISYSKQQYWAPNNKRWLIVCSILLYSYIVHRKSKRLETQTSLSPVARRNSIDVASRNSSTKQSANPRFPSWWNMIAYPTTSY